MGRDHQRPCALCLLERSTRPDRRVRALCQVGGVGPCRQRNCRAARSCTRRSNRAHGAAARPAFVDSLGHPSRACRRRARCSHRTRAGPGHPRRAGRRAHRPTHRQRETPTALAGERRANRPGHGLLDRLELGTDCTVARCTELHGSSDRRRPGSADCRASNPGGNPHGGGGGGVRSCPSRIHVAHLSASRWHGATHPPSKLVREPIQPI